MIGRRECIVNEVVICSLGEIWDIKMYGFR